MSRRKSRRRAGDHITHVYEFRCARLRIHLVNGGVFYEIKGDESSVDLIEREIAAHELSLHFGCTHEQAYDRLWARSMPCRVPLRQQEVLCS